MLATRCDLCAIATADLIAREFLGEGWSKVPSLKDVDEFMNLGHVSQSLFFGRFVTCAVLEMYIRVRVARSWPPPLKSGTSVLPTGRDS